MRVAVTGATGLVGGWVARAALDAGHDVVAVTREGAEPVVVGATALESRPAGLEDRAALGDALRGCDGLVHCAAVYAYGGHRAEEVERVNAAGTGTVLDAAADAGVRRVVVTSSSVTCGSSLLPRARTESDRLGEEPAPAYYASKVAQEEVALEAGLRRGLSVVVALPTVVLGGPFRRLAPSNAIVLRYLLDPTRSTFPGGCNVVDARDVGAGHVALLEQGEAGTRYLLGGDDVTWRELHGLVAELAGLPGPFAEASPASAWAVAAVTEWWAGLTETPPLSTRDVATTVGRYYWNASDRARSLGHTSRQARAAVASSLAWLAVSPDLPRWAREGLRLHPEVRAARDLVPSPLTTPEAVDPGRRPRRPAPAWPRRPR
jgi:dihydroflavonol-4-reductase